MSGSESSDCVVDSSSEEETPGSPEIPLPRKKAGRPTRSTNVPDKLKDSTGFAIEQLQHDPTGK